MAAFRSGRVELFADAYRTRIKPYRVQDIDTRMTASSIGLVLVTKHLDTDNAAYNAVQNFIDVYENDVERISIIGPTTISIDREGINCIPIQRRSSSGLLSRITGYIHYQIRLALKLFQTRDRYDVVFFHLGGSMLLMPILLCRLVGLRSVIVITGSIARSYSAQHGRDVLAQGIVRIVKGVEAATCTLSNKTVLLSKSMDAPSISGPFSTPVTVANFNYIDCGTFEKRVPMEERTYDIVFVGRLETVKGVKKIVRALPVIVDAHIDLRIKLIGDGSLRSDLENLVVRQGIAKHITFTGWINHDEIPSHLNDARTLLLPSESEGVPKTLLEAMACGTIPIGAPVGGVPDIITDGENGFLLPETDPDSIARTVSTVLSRKELETVSNNARQYIQKEHSYERVRERYRRILAGEECGEE